MSNRAIVFVALCFVTLTAITFPNEDEISAESITSRVDAIARAATDDQVSGLSITMAFGSETFLAEGWGVAPGGMRADAESEYGVGALLETWIRVAVLSFVDDETLALEDGLEKWFPQLASKESLELRHLLAHTSGLPDFTEWSSATLMVPEQFERESVISRLSKLPLESTPGDCFTFSRTNTLLLGWILADTGNASVATVLASRVFEPAGMDCAAFEEGEVPVLLTAGSCQEVGGKLEWGPGGVLPFMANDLHSCANDVMLFQRALVNRELLGEESTTMALSSTVLNNGSSTDHGLGFSLGNLGGYECLSYGGGQAGYMTRVAYYPTFDLTLVVLASGENAPVMRIERSIVRAVFDLPEPGTRTRDLPPEDRELYIGRFAIGCNQIEISFEDDHLVFQAVDYPRYELHYQGRHGFIAASDPEVRLIFELVDGKAISFVLDEYGRSTVATRME